MNEKTRKIDEATDFVLRLSTATGIAEALTNMVSYEHTAADLYEALIGCEWSAEAVAWAFNANARLMYVHDWHPVRTTPRTIVVEGTDNFGNKKNLYLRLDANEPDMCEGTTLKVTLTNRSRAPLAISNIVAHGHTTARFVNRLYNVVDKWSADAFAEALNKAYLEGATYVKNWKPKYTRDDKCAIAGFDGCGNEKTLIIRRS